MGLTHSWLRPTELPARAFSAAVKDIQLVLRATDIPLAGFEGRGQPVFLDDAVVFNGVDVVFNARIGSKGYVSGGMSTGSTVNDDCAVRPDSPQAVFCRTTNPETQVKAAGSYAMRWGLQVSGSIINVRGISVLANHVVTNAQVVPSLGRNLGQCGTAAVCTATVTVPLVPTGEMFEPRLQQLDVRFTRLFRVDTLRIRTNLDIANLFNASNVLNLQRQYGPTYLNVLQIMGGRLIKVGAQLDF